MKKHSVLEAVAKTLAAVKLGGKKSDPNLAKLDRGILTVGLLVAALDGVILPEEYAAFNVLARKCRGASAKNVRALLDAALPAAGHLMTMAQVGTYSEKERLSAFILAAAKALPRGFADGTSADLRRAFALWIAMGLSDGVFGDLERQAVNALYVHFAEVCLFKKRKVLCLERSFLEQAEKVLADFASPARRAKAEAALDALVSTEASVGAQGETIAKKASGLAVKLAAVATVGFASVGSAAVCREYGCTRYANPDGWCTLHQEQGRAYRAKKAAEKAEDRRVLREHEALVRLHDAEEAAVKSNELARLKKIERQQRREMKAEKEKFARPLAGLFGRKFGEPVPAGVADFTPDEPFRRFVGYGLRSSGTNGIVRIFAHAGFADEKSAIAERDAVLADLGRQYGRTPYKIFTQDGTDVRALGFGGTDGLVRQQLQVSVEKTEKEWRIDIVAFVLTKPQRALVSESEQSGRQGELRELRQREQ